MRIFPAQLESFCVEALLKVGVRESDARTTAEVLATTDSWGVFTHASRISEGRMIESLSAILTGAAITWQVPSWSFDDASLTTNHGAAFLAFNVAAMMPVEMFQERVAHLIQEIRQAPTAKGVERIYLPGEMEWERRERALTEGIDLPEDVVANLRLLAEELNLDLSRFSK